MTTTTSGGSPWVYIFSRFTSEALLFEALIIFSLGALYTGFWLLRKRKFGAIRRDVPASVVKYYLNELIVDAELLRSQLFGMLSGQGVPATPLAGVSFGQPAGAQAGVSPAIASASNQTLAALETKLVEQAKQIENFVAEKSRVEKELTEAKNAKGGAAGAVDPNASKLLQDKINQLEAKLAEYGVIEDDLANLKRLQQENASLKAQLAAGGKAAPAPVATAVPVAATSAAAAPAAVVDAEAAASAEPSVPAAAPVAGSVSQIASPGTGATSAAPPVATAPELGSAVVEAQNASDTAAFEGLVDQVEESLQSTDSAPVAAAAPETAAAAPSTTPPPSVKIERSDADLVAEFEKMLNG